MSGLTRPVGPVKIRKTEIVHPDVMVAKLSGAVCGEAKTVRVGSKYYFVPPEGPVKEVKAYSLTDCLHASVFEMHQEISAKRRGKKR